jgi:hypothetical protein
MFRLISNEVYGYGTETAYTLRAYVLHDESFSHNVIDFPVFLRLKYTTRNNKCGEPSSRSQPTLQFLSIV